MAEPNPEKTAAIEKRIRELFEDGLTQEEIYQALTNPFTTGWSGSALTSGVTTAQLSAIINYTYRELAKENPEAFPTAKKEAPAKKKSASGKDSQGYITSYESEGLLSGEVKIDTPAEFLHVLRLKLDDMYLSGKIDQALSQEYYNKVVEQIQPLVDKYGKEGKPTTEEWSLVNTWVLINPNKQINPYFNEKAIEYELKQFQEYSDYVATPEGALDFARQKLEASREDPVAYQQAKTEYDEVIRKLQEPAVAQAKMAEFINKRVQQELDKGWAQQNYNAPSMAAARERQTAIARQRTAESRYVPPPEQGVMPDEYEALDEALIGLSPEARNYWAQRPREILDPVTDARKKWWDTLHRAEMTQYVTGQISEHIGSLESGLAGARSEQAAWRGGEVSKATGKVNQGRLAGFGGAAGYAVSAQQRYAWRQPSPYAAGIAQLEKSLGIQREDLGQAQEEEESALMGGMPEDPLKAYLQQYPFQAKYLERHPTGRSSYPSRYAPFTYWRT